MLTSELDPDGTSLSEDRLSRTSTIWSLVLKANRGGVDGDPDTLEEMIHRYHGAVDRYFLGAVRNNDTADELFQEFALRFARGGFRNVDQGKGRFRGLIEEVGSSVATTDLSRIEEELIDVDLLAYCRSALDKRRIAAS